MTTVEKVVTGISICAIFIPLVVGWFVRVKAKSDKADVEKIVDDKLLATNKEIEDMKKTQEFFKDAIQEITTYNKLAAEKSKNTRANIQDTLDRQGKAFEEFTKKQSSHNSEVLTKLEKLSTTQAINEAINHS